MKIITIEIENGEVSVDLEGFHGKGCAAVQEGFAKAVGKATAVQPKREFNAPIIAANRLKQGK